MTYHAVFNLPSVVPCRDDEDFVLFVLFLNPSIQLLAHSIFIACAYPNFAAVRYNGRK
jgi:hypothetical protein